MYIKSRQNHDAWVLWVTGAFLLTAVGVFAFAISHRHRARPIPASNLPSESSSPLPNVGTFRVARIIDGDTFAAVGSDGIELIIRLRGIDAPELGQGHGFEAKQALEGLIGSGVITIDKPSREKYGRYLANVFERDTWVNKTMVEDGHAWYDHMASTDKTLHAAEDQARQRKIGVWSSSDPVEPWVWRAKRK